MEEMKVSVVITVLNDVAGITALLTTLSRQSEPADEVIVVDGGSTDGTTDAVERFVRSGYRVRLLREPGCNISKGRNLGIKHARNEIIACTDAGCVPEQTWLAKLTKPFCDANVAVVGGVCRADTHNRLEHVIGLMTVPGELSTIEPASYNPSARNIAFRKAAWRRAGGFPEWLYTAEDTLFDCQLRKLGVGFAYAPGALVRWRPRQSLLTLWRQISGYAQGEGHIGRAGESARFWFRRYAVILFILLICIASAYALTSTLLIALGLGAATILLVIPLASMAYRVAYKTGLLLDFPLAVVIGQLMAVADLFGYARGASQRLRNPEDYIKPLKEYWGESAVINVPQWQLLNTTVPQTLIVSWHWAPNSRACANVLSNLFIAADKDEYSVITRAVPPPKSGDTIAIPTLPTRRVQWPKWCSQECGFVFTMASIMTMLRLVLRATLLHRARQYDRTIAVYPHRFSILSGVLISMVTGTKLVIYMHDLFAESLAGRGVIHRTLWRIFDRIALKRAWLIIVPTREFADHYRRRGLSNTVVIPHCLPAEPRTLAGATEKSESITPGDIQVDVPKRLAEKCVGEYSQAACLNVRTNLVSAQVKAFGSEQNQQIKIVYAGKVYEAHDDAIRALVGATQSLAGAELTLLSNANAAAHSSASTWISRRDALRAIERSDVGVVALGIQTPYPTEIAGCFPSKIIDYIAIGRPILAVVPPGCFVDRFVRENGCGVAVESFSAVDIQAAIAELSDPKSRERMAKSILAVRDKLSARHWVTILNRRLAAGPVTPVDMPIVSKQASDTLLNLATPALFELESGVSP